MLNAFDANDFGPTMGQLGAAAAAAAAAAQQRHPTVCSPTSAASRTVPMSIGSFARFSTALALAYFLLLNT
ncbi:unnamed protein product [Strongylus vulgaris]|uniref:Uncharacterized protein n=1 Tax=Strongylus vulgaris TaxID=40348 RepID=A0A3P7JG65_STRVU|nr:unnamed protein product [Strongylus vulgaris]